MAALWGLTGSLDPRRTQDGKVSDIVNDDSKVSLKMVIHQKGLFRTLSHLSYNPTLALDCKSHPRRLNEQLTFLNNANENEKNGRPDFSSGWE